MAVQPFSGRRSAVSDALTLDTFAAPARRPQLRATALRVWLAIEVWIERYRQRRQLQRLSDHLLRDMGIDRAEAVCEADKPFWRA
jgi:uncharacterized protein YjiS (DUF1127 family)